MADLFWEGGGGLMRVGWPGIVVKSRGDVRCCVALRMGGMRKSFLEVLLIARCEHSVASMGWERIRRRSGSDISRRS